MLKTLALLPLLALPAAAQQGTVPPLTFPVPAVAPQHTTVQTLPQGCPIGISAEPPTGMPESLRVRSAHDQTARTGVHVHFESALWSPAIANSHITVAVRYRDFGRGLRPAAMPLSQVLSKTFELNVADAESTERNLVVAGSVEILSVRVLKIAYANGTTWVAASDTFCSAKPSHVVLVGARQAFSAPYPR